MYSVFLRIQFFTIDIVTIKIYYYDKNQTGNTMEKRTDSKFFCTAERDGCEVTLSAWLVPQNNREIFG